MSLDVLEKLASELGNEELTNAVNGVKQTIKTNTQKLSTLEKDSQEAFAKRDSLKGLIKNKLGLDEISEEALDGFLSKQGTGDESVKNEIKNLTSMVEMLKADKEGLQSKYVDTLNGMKLEKELMTLGAMSEVENARAYDILLADIKKGATVDEEGNVFFKANDGTTIRKDDGSPMTLADRYNQLKDSDDMNFLFKTRRSKAGSSAAGGKANGKVTSLEGLNEAQRIALFKQDPEQYKKLAGLN